MDIYCHSRFHSSELVSKVEPLGIEFIFEVLELLIKGLVCQSLRVFSHLNTMVVDLGHSVADIVMRYLSLEWIGHYSQLVIKQVLHQVRHEMLTLRWQLGTVNT